ncbi:MAG TPA: SCP2 sterol-binding domain-containing protein [Acidimicrobiia bacterium]|nr:SCP2 sterol-binding domain-containing protein [Acidimicrobiia bacterium]
MPAYLSPEWCSAFADALSGEPLPDVDGPSAACVVRQCVTGTPFGTVAYDVALRSGRLQVDLEIDSDSDIDGADDADVVMQLDYDTAVAVSQGRLSAQEAISAGRIVIRGRLERIVAARAVLTAIADRARNLRARTTYDSGP